MSDDVNGIKVDDPQWRSLDRSLFENGKLLRHIYAEAKASGANYNQFLLFSCIRDTPFLALCKSGGDISKKDFAVAELTSKTGAKYMPIFSDEDQIGATFEDFPDHVLLSFEECVTLAENAGLDIIIDAFSNQMVVPMSLAKKIVEIPTRIKEDA